jgi:ABC-type sugar transport system ATPase subunit
VGIRPEAFKVSTSGIPVTITLTENLGSDTLVYAELAGQECWFLTATRDAPKRGENVHLSVPAEEVHVFEQGTLGARIEA